MVDVSAILIFRESFLTSPRSVLQVMGDEAKDKPGHSALPGTADLKAMFSELLNDAKKDILAQAKESIDQVYMDFDSVEVEAEDPQSGAGANPEDSQDAAVAGKIEELFSLRILMKTRETVTHLSLLLRSSVSLREHPLPSTLTWRR